MKNGSENRKSREPLLIANRGEIAIRISKTAKILGFPTVGVYSEVDRFSEHVRACDRAVFLGGSVPSESYLNIEKIIDAAKKTGARYIHPGYGFLSERPHFVEACEKEGLVFVGPSAKSMRLMGDKITARRTVESLGVPGVPGTKGAVSSPEEAIAFGRQVGFPILLKATAGGGGKGMRRVDSEVEVRAALEGASREALSAFGDGSMYVEKLVLKPHHVEIQVFGDGKGAAIHLGERECSIQRRHQKVWEESPSPILERFPKTREAMCQAAIKIASSVNYAGAGTFEFIVDEAGQFYFLEMNTRLQVEHPVTELVTGVDLVAWQLLLASGEFCLPKSSPEQKGSAIEVRLYAEDPNHFLPAPGSIGSISLPAGPFVRVDTAFTGPGEVSVFYDPMIAKIAVWAPTRLQAIGRMRVALDETRVEKLKGSLKTNLSFLKRLVRLPAVHEGDTPTDLIPMHPELTAEVGPEGALVSNEAAIALSIFQLVQDLGGDLQSNPGMASDSLWKFVARREGGSEMSSSISGKIGSIQLEWITFSSSRKGSGKVKVDGRVYDVSWTMDSFGLWLELSHGVFGFDCQPVSDDEGRVTYQLRSRQGIENHPSLSFVRGSDGAGAGELVQKKKARRIKSQMPGKIIRLNVKAGDRVEKDEVLLVMEAMKMENPIRASHAGKVSTVTVTEGQAVETGAELLILGD